jgi:regulator of replication initiation timing
MSGITGETEKEMLIDKIIELQNTLQDLTRKIDVVRNENQDLRDENILLKEYINNLMQKAGNISTDSLS